MTTATLQQTSLFGTLFNLYGQITRIEDGLAAGIVRERYSCLLPKQRWVLQRLQRGEIDRSETDRDDVLWELLQICDGAVELVEPKPALCRAWPEIVTRIAARAIQKYDNREEALYEVCGVAGDTPEVVDLEDRIQLLLGDIFLYPSVGVENTNPSFSERRFTTFLAVLEREGFASEIAGLVRNGEMPDDLQSPPALLSAGQVRAPKDKAYKRGREDTLKEGIRRLAQTGKRVTVESLCNQFRRQIPPGTIKHSDAWKNRQEIIREAGGESVRERSESLDSSTNSIVDGRTGSQIDRMIQEEDSPEI